jgi:hypothetical protein
LSPLLSLIGGGAVGSIISNTYNSIKDKNDKAMKKREDDALKLYVLISLYQEFKINEINLSKDQPMEIGFLSMFWQKYSYSTLANLPKLIKSNNTNPNSHYFIK